MMDYLFLGFGNEFSEFFGGMFFFSFPLILAYIFLVSFFAQKTLLKGKTIFYFPKILTLIGIIIEALLMLLGVVNCSLSDSGSCGMIILVVPSALLILVYSFLLSLFITWVTKKLNPTPKKYIYFLIGLVVLYLALLIPYLVMYGEARPEDNAAWTKMAINENNPDLCNKINTGLFDKEQNDWRRTSCLADGGKNTGNIKFCEAISINAETEWFADECFTSVAAITTDPKLCYQVSKKAQDNCILLVQGADLIKSKRCQNKKDMKTCFKDECPAYYDTIDSTHIINCLATSAQLTGDKKYCESIPTTIADFTSGYNYEAPEDYFEGNYQGKCLTGTKLFTNINAVYPCHGWDGFSCLNNLCREFDNSFSIDYNHENLKYPIELGELRNCYKQAAIKYKEPAFCTNLYNELSIYQCLDELLVNHNDLKDPKLCEVLRDKEHYVDCQNLMKN